MDEEKQNLGRSTDDLETPGMGHWGAGSMTSQIWRPHRVLWRTHKAPGGKEKTLLGASQLNQKGAKRREESCADVPLQVTSRRDARPRAKGSANPKFPTVSPAGECLCVSGCYAGVRADLLGDGVRDVGDRGGAFRYL